MPNGADKNWVRVCTAIDGFIAKHGHKPTLVEMNPLVFADLVGHVLNRPGFGRGSPLICFMRGPAWQAGVHVVFDTVSEQGSSRKGPPGGARTAA